MAFFFRHLSPALLFAILFFSPALTLAETGAPPELAAWSEWVLEGRPELRCAVKESGRICVWPGKLDLSLGRSGGDFKFNVRVDKKSRIPLPGGNGIWPLSVRSQGSSAALALIRISGKPFVELEAGNHLVSGSFEWKKLPEYIRVPTSAGLVSLSVEGEKVERPKVGKNGELALIGEAETEVRQEDTLRLKVFRQLYDGVPFKVVSRLALRVSGRSREVQLGNFLLAGMTPLKVQSALNYRYESEKGLIVQVKPGQHTIEITSVAEAPPTRIAWPENTGEHWPAEEIWVWRQNEELRSVELSGAPAVDPNRTELPANWRGAPTYVLTSKDVLQLKETRKGESGVPLNVFRYNRTFWLDLDGSGYTVKDQINGTLHSRWRVNLDSGMEPGQITTNGTPQVITRDVDTQASGVELRDQNFSIQAVSRIGRKAELPAVGWDQDAKSLSVQLNLPPGWKLFEASGVDTLSRSWISQWTLLDLFIVILMSAAFFKLFGAKWGALALVALIITRREPEAPFYLWVNLLAVAGLLRVLSENTFTKYLRYYFSGSLLFLVAAFISFSFRQIRAGLYPQLDSSVYLHYQLFYLIGVLAAIGAVLFALGAVGALFRFKWKDLFRGVALTVVLGAIGWIAILSMTTLGSMVGGRYDGATYDDARVQTAQRLLSKPMELMEQEAPSSADMYRGKGSTAYKRKLGRLTQVDPKAVVQTGPGLPNWGWRSWNLRWSGPVSKDHTFSVYLLSPTVNFILAVLRVLLFGLLVLSFFRFAKENELFKKLVPFLLVLMLALPSQANAQSFPDSDMLKELEKRLIQDICQDSCVSASSLDMDVRAETVKIVAEVHSRGSSAWAVPGPLSQLLPAEIRVNGSKTTALRRAGGHIWVRLEEGVNTVEVDAILMRSHTATIQFLVEPGHVRVKTDEWNVDGVSETGGVGSSIQLTRAVKRMEGQEPIKPAADSVLPQWYKVRRQIGIGLPWTVITVVERLGDTERPIHTKVPLLAGESVNTEGLEVKEGFVKVKFPRGQREVVWSSTLELTPELSLIASKDMSLTENWEIECSPIWRCSFSGIKPIKTRTENKWKVVYQPWPAEQAKIEIQKPTGISGSSITIDRVDVELSAGKRILNGKITATARASQGGWRKFTLPDDASLDRVSINGKARGLELKDGKLDIPLLPGSQTILISWQQPWGGGIVRRIPKIDLGGEAANLTVQWKLASKRWLMYAGGPKWGPVVLFWYKVIILLILAVVIGKWEQVPLGTKESVLLALGLASLSPYVLVIPFLWFLFMNLRKQFQPEDRSLFNLVQFLLAGLTLATVLVLYTGLEEGLLLKPDMIVRGNGSHSGLLKWYVDRVSGPVFSATVVSLPIWVWRAVMLAWSTWMVFFVLRRASWGWECFSQGGIWRGKKIVTPDEKG